MYFEFFVDLHLAVLDDAVGLLFLRNVGLTFLLHGQLVVSLEAVDCVLHDAQKLYGDRGGHEQQALDDQPVTGLRLAQETFDQLSLLPQQFAVVSQQVVRHVD